MHPLHVAALAFLAVLSTLVLPLPEELALLGCGYLARAGQTTLPLALLAGYLGVYAGDLTTFLASRWLIARALRTRAGERILSPRRRDWAERMVRRRGAWTIVIARFLVGLRGPVYMALGASRFPRKRFALVNGAVATVEVAAMVLLGWLIGPSDKLVRGSREVELGVAALLLFAIAVPWLVRRLVDRHAAA